jgi:hypothetical protein
VFILYAGLYILRVWQVAYLPAEEHSAKIQVVRDLDNSLMALDLIVAVSQIHSGQERWDWTILTRGYRGSMQRVAVIGRSVVGLERDRRRNDATGWTVTALIRTVCLPRNNTARAVNSSSGRRNCNGSPASTADQTKSEALLHHPRLLQQ